MNYKPNAVQELAAKVSQEAAARGGGGSRRKIFSTKVATNKNRVGQFKVIGTGKVVTIWFSKEHDTVAIRARNDLKFQRFHGNRAATTLVDIGLYIGMGLYRWEVRDPRQSAAVREFILKHFPEKGTSAWSSSGLSE